MYTQIFCNESLNVAKSCITNYNNNYSVINTYVYIAIYYHNGDSEYCLSTARLQIKKLNHEKEQLRKEMFQLQQSFSQREAGLGEWRDAVDRAGRRRAEKKQHTQDKMFSYR